MLFVDVKDGFAIQMFECQCPEAPGCECGHGDHFALPEGASRIEVKHDLTHLAEGPFQVVGDGALVGDLERAKKRLESHIEYLKKEDALFMELDAKVHPAKRSELVDKAHCAARCASLKDRIAKLEGQLALLAG